MSNIELKPCPFCGNEGHLSQHGDSYIVSCFDCGAQIDYCASEEEAVKAWNKRTQ